jgi:hypothetical protein
LIRRSGEFRCPWRAQPGSQANIVLCRTTRAACRQRRLESCVVHACNSQSRKSCAASRRSPRVASMNVPGSGPFQTRPGATDEDHPVAAWLLRARCSQREDVRSHSRLHREQSCAVGG